MSDKKPGRPRGSERTGFALDFYRARTRKRQTQREVADDLHVHPVTVARWEAGMREPRGLARAYLVEWMQKEKNDE